jgi:hypothetical protein
MTKLIVRYYKYHEAPIEIGDELLRKIFQRELNKYTTEYDNLRDEIVKEICILSGIREDEYGRYDVDKTSITDPQTLDMIKQIAKHKETRKNRPLIKSVCRMEIRREYWNKNNNMHDGGETEWVYEPSDQYNQYKDMSIEDLKSFIEKEENSSGNPLEVRVSHIRVGESKV